MDGVTSAEFKAFVIASPRETDSLNTGEWKSFLDRNRLNEAWSPPEGSPYRHFEKTRTIDSINKWANALKPRYSEAESNSEWGIVNLIKSGILGKDTAVILDSGGPHSVAMAANLARELGYQPIVMFDAEPNPQGIGKPEQELATLLYYAQEIIKLKSEGKIRANAPPVFILNAHRSENFKGFDQGKVDNSYSYRQNDFPSAQQFREQGITKIVYVNESDKHGKIIPSSQSIDRVIKDLKPLVTDWEQSGIQMVFTGVKPWVKMDRHYLKSDYGSEIVQEPGKFRKDYL